MTFIKFTDPDGADIWIAPRWVTKVRTPLIGRHAGNARALIVMGTIEQAVTQTVETVIYLLEGGGTDDDDDAAVRRA
jgi:hypothetical protein